MIVGQKWMGAATLHAVAAAGHEVVRAAAPFCAGEEYDRLYAAALQRGIPAIHVGQRLSASDVPAAVDVIVAAHAHTFIAPDARAKAKHGAIGYHPSLLPRHRGRDAVRWTIHMGDPVAGGTVYQMDDGADTGPIICQDWCHVRAGDTPEFLWRRDLGPMGIRLILQALEMLESGKAILRPQDEAPATWEPAFRKAKLSEAPPAPKNDSG